ncbi:MAG: hypothetical protein DRH70_03895, partial [Candidatus Coatesbacteria bacterium]
EKWRRQAAALQRATTICVNLIIGVLPGTTISAQTRFCDKMWLQKAASSGRTREVIVQLVELILAVPGCKLRHYR